MSSVQKQTRTEIYSEKLSFYQHEVAYYITERSFGNMALCEGSQEREIKERRNTLARRLGANTMVFMQQVHGNNVEIISRDSIEHDSSPVPGGFVIAQTDAIVTREQDIALCVQTADCIPIFFFDSKQRVVAAVHAGRKGTLLRVVDRTLENMSRFFSSSPKTLICFLGPGIGPCCHVVSPDDINEALREDLAGVDKSRRSIDLWEANRRQLLARGVLPSNIEVASWCTVCHKERFFSYRAGDTSDRFLSAIMLRGDD